MKRKTTVVQISGFRGIVMAIFVVTCLAAGFIAFPSLVAMYAWNALASFVAIPVINGLQGLMLWAIIAITGFIINDKYKYLSTFSAKGRLSEEQVKRIIDKAKIQAQARALDSMILKSEDLKSLKKEEMSEEKEKENV